MDSPECTLLSLVKVEDEGREFKEELINEGDDMEYVQVEDALSPGESSSEHDMTEINDSVSALVSFSEGDMACPINFSKIDSGTRRRLRFSESDDMVLLRKVAALNPYECAALWKEVTQVVALRAGKNFSVRSIRDHTDLLMNTYSLRGSDFCLKRAPPELWEKKKQLLQTVYSMWKKHSYQFRSGSSGSNGANKSGADSSVEETPRHYTRTSKLGNTEPPPASNWSSPKSSSSRHTRSSNSRIPSVPLLMEQPNVPFTLHLGTAIQSLTCPPLLSSSPHSSMQSLAAASQALQNLSPHPGFPSTMLGSLASSHRNLLSTHSNSAPDVVTDTISSDQPISLITNNSSLEPRRDSIVPRVVDRCTSPIPSIDCSVKEKNSVSTQCDPSEKVSVSAQNDVQHTSLTASVDSSTGNANPELHRLDWRTNERRRKIRKISLMMRSRMDFLMERYRNQFSLKRRKLAMERRKIALEERKLILDEKKVQLEEEKWQFDKKEREEKILLMTEEREHKMAMERRQQNMIDILLELKKKD